MKYITAILLIVLCLIGALALLLVTRDRPQYASGEPIAMVKDWLNKQPKSTPSMTSYVNAALTVNIAAGEDQDESIWTEEYIGHGKWLVSKANIQANFSKTEMTFEEWNARTQGWDANRFTEYAGDLSPEDQQQFQAELRSYNSGQQDFTVTDEWYIYEKSGLIEAVKN